MRQKCSIVATKWNPIELVNLMDFVEVQCINKHLAFIVSLMERILTSLCILFFV